MDQDEDGGRTATEAPLLRPRRPHRRRRRTLAALGEAGVVVVSALVLSLLVTTFLARPFSIPSASMEPALLEGDRVLATPLVPGPLPLQRGDVVVFADRRGWLGDDGDGAGPAAGEVGAAQRGPAGRAAVVVLTWLRVLPDPAQGHLVKRVIGLPGDRVVCCDAQGRVSVDGASLDERPYLPPGAVTTQVPFDVSVPAGELWVMGDNRGDSRDSRYHQDVASGLVAQDAVVGRAVLRVWPLDRVGWLPRHGEVFAAVPDPPPAG
ncbi:signal peptidase I [Streptomyces sp. NP160]|uniref:signal peptidase I n=1 Tax=Streptomyces sp. NP160 TaxID=2586637 RepID=UPI001119D07F|nr:signal peptidase I [Streptomyces sp. NP160]TNM67736.1 signal peptidase I [Streptomyces sp. NP160]